jgi:glycosyltransferase involved in cell wall biosynthesis
VTSRAPVSAIVTTYNDAPYLRGALDSVARQTALPAQIMVIDDGSRDDAAAQVCATFSAETGLAVDYVRRDNGGASAARNEGLARADQPYLAYLDADDRWFPRHVELKLQRLVARDERYSSAYDGFLHVDTRGRARRNPQASAYDGPIDEEVLLTPGRAPGGMQCTLHRTAALRAVDGSDTALRMWEDIDLMLRMGRAGYHISGSSEPTVRRLMRLESLTNADARRSLEATLAFADKAERESLISAPYVQLIRRRAHLWAGLELVQRGDADTGLALIRDAFRHGPPAGAGERLVKAVAELPVAWPAGLLVRTARLVRNTKLSLGTARLKRRYPDLRAEIEAARGYG